MALAKMSKARIAVHKSKAAELAEKLQSLGCCEFIPQDEEKLEAESVVNLRFKLSHINDLMADANYLIRLLEPFETDKESSLSKMLGDIPQVDLVDLESNVDEKNFSEILTLMKSKDNELASCHSNETRLKGLLSQLETFEQLKWPLEFFTIGTESVVGEIYSIPRSLSGDFSTTLSKEFGDYTELYEFVGKDNNPEVTYALLFSREKSADVQNLAASFSATRVDVPKEFKGLASKEKSKILAEINNINSTKETLTSEIASNANSTLKMARDYYDYWSILKDRLSSMLSTLATEEVLIWTLWIPTSRLKVVKNHIKKYENLIDFDLIDPDENEFPPTLLKNSKLASSVEPLTLMYGTPTYGKVDPSTLMAPFFFLFMGMCFGDAGYGLILTAIFGYILVKHKLTPVLRKFFVLLTTAMVLTVFVGAATGSWFGDSITAFPFLKSLIPFKDAVQFLDPMNDPMTFLIISLALGFVHIIFGLVIAMVANWKEGERVAALFDQAAWIVFLLALVVMGISMGGVLSESFVLPSKIVSILSMLLLILTQGREKKNIFARLFAGVLSLYNVTGYLGDVLSYSRLLALGLGSAAVGMVINLLGTLVADTPYVGIFLAALIFIIGHTFSIVVNLLGSFVHSLRLQYVEFFGKFYDAKGKDFSPLTYQPKYSSLKSETLTDSSL